MSICCKSGELFMSIAILLFGSIFKILFSWDLISCMAEMLIGVAWVTLHRAI